MKLTQFTMPRCQACHEMGEYLRRRQLSFEQVDITQDVTARSFIQVRNGGRVVAPALHDGDTGQMVVGFSAGRVDRFLGEVT